MTLDKEFREQKASDDERARLGCVLLLRNAIARQLKARGVEGVMSVAREVDGVVQVKVDGKEVAVEMTNSIQALWQAAKKGNYE